MDEDPTDPIELAIPALLQIGSSRDLNEDARVIQEAGTKSLPIFDEDDLEAAIQAAAERINGRSGQHRASPPVLQEYENLIDDLTASGSTLEELTVVAQCIGATDFLLDGLAPHWKPTDYLSTCDPEHLSSELSLAQESLPIVRFESYGRQKNNCNKGNHP
ncbi:hypothetical protein [Herbidospora cretacea]|uniref:hypothetical protein n=1 Tax=Herbidospora cretacea TaxID=28444 RepID=UPI0012DDB560|nr:hypothetical protein [Herbidospora cretacea]